jgi:hypothetical protein
MKALPAGAARWIELGIPVTDGTHQTTARQHFAPRFAPGQVPPVFPQQAPVR